MCGVSQKDRRRNSDVKERCSLKEDVVTRVEKGILRWFRHLESGGARRRRRRRPPTASRLKGPRKQKSFAYKLLKRGLANLMSSTSTSGVAPPLLLLLQF
ncbi:hypothetical protein EVAR_78123_1 [Eumeta japonica]|uniref:Uncharacterized protein n=1 Tax=Eumeta variegata TaxID=151549 RepID=A0A4C1T0M1_EUMVA|nr:hypothetical protein EVAR_78123_1 [Eumeta japonica]